MQSDFPVFLSLLGIPCQVSYLWYNGCPQAQRPFFGPPRVRAVVTNIKSPGN